MTKNSNPKAWKRPNLLGTPQNKTTQFLLPALSLSSEKTGYKLLQYFGFINCYLDHRGGNEPCTWCLYLVFNPNDEAIKRFKDFYTIYRSYSNFVTDYIVDDHLVVVVFKVKEKWRATLEAFKKSKYSMMSKEYAEMFKRPLMNGNVQVSDEYYIIHKNKEFKRHLEDSLTIITPDFRDVIVIDDEAELMSPLIEEQEYFSYEIQNQ